MHNQTEGQSQTGGAPEGRSARVYCSEQNGQEPVWGTADCVDVWLLLEYRPVWKARVLQDNDLAVPVQRWLNTTLEALAAAGYRARPQFIRRPEIDDDRTRLLIAGNDALVEFSGVGYGFLEDVDAVAAMRKPGAAAQQNLPLYFVCTNGQRDLCCARFGLPLYAGLRERVMDRVWQVNHLGGHRFAPNVLTLPDACLYGRVTPERLDDFLAHTEHREVDFQHLRGRTRYPPMVQAAEASVARNGLRLMQVEGDEREAVVTFADDFQLVKVGVKRSDDALPVLKSCGDEGAGSVYPYVTSRIQTIPG